MTPHLLAAILIGAICLSTSGVGASGGKPDFQAITGEWARTDGGYTVHVRSVKEDGTAHVGYFNPRQINVAEARVSVFKGLIELHIKLQDQGYPGSTYTLYYYEEKDAMVGFYYQAAADQTYEVIFLRKTSR